MNKKGLDLLGRVIFILLVVMFFLGMLYFIVRAGTQASVTEQVYAKNIALMIDNAKPGTVIYYDISELYEVAEKNTFKGRVVIIDNEKKKVRVALIMGKGYEFDYFSGANIEWSLNDEEKELFMEIK